MTATNFHCAPLRRHSREGGNPCGPNRTPMRRSSPRVPARRHHRKRPRRVAVNRWPRSSWIDTRAAPPRFSASSNGRAHERHRGAQARRARRRYPRAALPGTTRRRQADARRIAGRRQATSVRRAASRGARRRCGAPGHAPGHRRSTPARMEPVSRRPGQAPRSPGPDAVDRRRTAALALGVDGAFVQRHLHLVHPSVPSGRIRSRGIAADT